MMSKFLTVEGEVLGYLPNRYGIHNRVQISTDQGELMVKFPKEWSHRIYSSIAVGEKVQVRGKLKEDDEGTLYLKAEVVLHLKDAVRVSVGPSQLPTEEVIPPTLPTARVLVCTKSDCCKRGAKQLVKSLEESVERYGLQDQVTIQTTGCMKRCKEGPNLVIMPQKSRYSNVRPAQAPELLLREILPKVE
ncbi:MAG: NAD(P)H-dependent oxidoreductase subunit E [Anaerolineae bacterium]|nr:NAD(P)H-dependent oxidoreductase subunit E [Gloeobacterales cyanobacterium ES-bin-313]